MVQGSITYHVWMGGFCDYGYKKRAGGGTVVIEHNDSIFSRNVISDLHATEFRMMLTLMVKGMQELPEGSGMLFLTNAVYIQTFNKAPNAQSTSPDLILQCVERKKRHSSERVKIIPYHKSSLLIETYDMATEAMAKRITVQGDSRAQASLRATPNRSLQSIKEYYHDRYEQALLAQMQDLGYSHGLCVTTLHILSQSKLPSATCLPISMTNSPWKKKL